MNPYWWLAIAAVLAVIEILSQSLITVWFFVGGIAAFVAAMLGADLLVQVIVFLAVSLVCLAALRPLIMKHRKIGESHEPTLVGASAIVVERVDAQAQTGRVETPDHMTWMALPDDGEPIDVGERVRVIDQRSIKLVVRREQT